MARPRSFSSDQVVEAAKSVFWHKGYRHTAIEELERTTGLNRSSLYAAFGTKQAIFDDALDAYLDDFIGPRLASMERRGARVGDIERFFVELAAFFRTDKRARRGCLMVNSIAEHAGRDTHLGDRAEVFRDRLHTAFANALPDTKEPALGTERARLLTATTFGIWVMARIDPAHAAETCEATIGQLQGWEAPQDDEPRR